MRGKIHLRIPLFSTRATATLSVALVLLILGMASMVGIGAGRLGDAVMENLGFVVVFADDVTASDVNDVTTRLRKSDAVSNVTYNSADVILDRWQKIVGEEENILSLAGVNPFSPEHEVNVKPAYASADSLTALVQPLTLLPQVSDVRLHTDIVSSVNRTMRSVELTLIIIAVALLLVSFVLIFNTVRLSVYSNRFLINTMQLVGATRGFVRRPFLIENMVNGFAAGIIASGLLALALYATQQVDPMLAVAVQWWPDAAIVTGGMIFTGVIICVAASAVACNRYLNLSYDQLFK